MFDCAQAFMLMFLVGIIRF